MLHKSSNINCLCRSFHDVRFAQLMDILSTALKEACSCQGSPRILSSVAHRKDELLSTELIIHITNPTYIAEAVVCEDGWTLLTAKDTRRTGSVDLIIESGTAELQSCHAVLVSQFGTTDRRLHEVRTDSRI